MNGLPLTPPSIKVLVSDFVLQPIFEISLLRFQFVADSPLMVPPKMQGHEVAFNKIFDYGSSVDVDVVGS